MSINLINAFRYIIPYVAGDDNSIWLGKIVGTPINILADAWNAGIIDGHDMSAISSDIKSTASNWITPTIGWNTNYLSNVPTHHDELLQPFVITTLAIAPTFNWNQNYPPSDISEIQEDTINISGLYGGLENL